MLKGQTHMHVYLPTLDICLKTIASSFGLICPATQYAKKKKMAEERVKGSFFLSFYLFLF